MDPFFLKKLVSNFVHLVPALFIWLLIAVLLLRVYPKLARTLILMLSISLLALSSAPVSNAIVAPLENRYPVLESLPDNTALVLLLGFGHHYTADRPPNSVLMAVALSRLSEAVRLVKTNEQAKLLVSGAKFRSLVVVSSATHLTRAAMLLEGSGINHTMAPTDFRMLDAPWHRFSAYHLQNVDIAVHEYVGMLWYKLK